MKLPSYSTSLLLVAAIFQPARAVDWDPFGWPGWVPEEHHHEPQTKGRPLRCHKLWPDERCYSKSEKCFEPHYDWKRDDATTLSNQTTHEGFEFSVGASLCSARTPSSKAHHRQCLASLNVSSSFRARSKPIVLRAPPLSPLRCTAPLTTTAFCLPDLPHLSSQPLRATRNYSNQRIIVVSCQSRATISWHPEGWISGTQKELTWTR